MTVAVGSNGTLSQPSTPTGGVVGALRLFDRRVGFEFEVGGRRRRAVARHRQEVFFAFLAGVAVEEQLRFDRLQRRFDERAGRALRPPLRAGRCRFRTTRGSRRRGCRAPRASLRGAQLTWPFEEQVHVFDERRDAFDVDAEQQRQVRFLGQVVDVAFEFEHACRRDRQFDEGLELDEARLCCRPGTVSAFASNVAFGHVPSACGVAARPGGTSTRRRLTALPFGASPVCVEFEAGEAPRRVAGRLREELAVGRRVAAVRF